MISTELFIGGVCAASILTSAWHELPRVLARRRAREQTCPHPPEARTTCRVNNIQTINLMLLHAVIPGRRFLVKHCRLCGKQWNMYREHLQSFDEFMAEFDQETIDRAAQLQARTQAHVNEQALLEEQRLKRRAKNLP